MFETLKSKIQEDVNERDVFNRWELLFLESIGNRLMEKRTFKTVKEFTNEMIDRLQDASYLDEMFERGVIGLDKGKTRSAVVAALINKLKILSLIS